MKKCEDIERKLTSYIDESLSREERSLVEEHLRTCSDCARALDELERTKDLLEGLDEVEPPAWLAAKIMSRINEENEAKAGFFRKLFFPLHIKIPAEVLAAACVVVLSVLVYRATIPDMANVRQTPPEVQVSKQVSINTDSTGQQPSAAKTTPVKTASRDTSGKDSPRREAAAVERPKEMQHAQTSPQKTLAAQSEIEPGPSKKESAHGQTAPEIYGAGNKAVEGRMKDELSVSGGGTKPYPAVKMKTDRSVAPGAAMKEEKASEPARKLTQAASAPRPRHRFSVVADTPPEAARKAKEILHSLESKEVKEKKQGETTIIYGCINPNNIVSLIDRLKKIGAVQGGEGTPVNAAADQVLVEIVIISTDKDLDRKGD